MAFIFGAFDMLGVSQKYSALAMLGGLLEHDQ
jgi:hypothetical protein